MIPRWAPWLAAGALAAGLAFTARGCAALKTERARYAAEVKRMESAVQGAKSNEAVALEALRNKDKDYRDLEASSRRSACDGVAVERFGPDGRLTERRCEGKASSEETSSRTKTGTETTPVIDRPFEPPPPIQPGPSAEAGKPTRWAVGLGAGVSLDPLVAPVYYASVERRMLGPIGVGGWAHWPALCGGAMIAVRW